VLTKQEMAVKLKISIPTLDKLRKDGLPTIKVGESIRFDENEVDVWLKAQREKEQKDDR